MATALASVDAAGSSRAPNTKSYTIRSLVRWSLTISRSRRDGPVRSSAGRRRLRAGLRKGLAGSIWKRISDPTPSPLCSSNLLTALARVTANLVFASPPPGPSPNSTSSGKNLLVTLIDIPFGVSPVISGLIFVLVFGAQRLVRPLVNASRHSNRLRRARHHSRHNLRHISVRSPRTDPSHGVARQRRRGGRHLAGRGAWQIFRRITLPNISWGLLYGVVLATARALGEFGAVSVVSGHIRGQTNTLPLHVEILYNEYNFAVPSRWPRLLSWSP